MFGPNYDPLWLAHGGEGETACVMALGYDVDRENIPDRIENQDFLKMSRSSEVYSIVQNLKKYAKNGTWGEAKTASSKTGEKIFEIVSRHLAQLIPEQFEN